MQIQLSPHVQRKTVAGRFFLFLWCGQVVCSAIQISHFSHGLAQFNADVTNISDCHFFGSGLSRSIRVGVFDGDRSTRETWTNKKKTELRDNGEAEEPKGGV